MTALSFFSRGKRGVLYAGELQATGERVVAKLAADVEAQVSVTAEARWLREMNRLGLGAKLLDAGPGWFLSERLEGFNAVEFLTQPAAVVSRQDALWLVREMLTQVCTTVESVMKPGVWTDGERHGRQCFTMDLMGVNKAEMTHPHRHIIVHRRADASGWKCSFVDFEKCAYSTKPKNVTQLCQVPPAWMIVRIMRPNANGGGCVMGDSFSARHGWWRCCTQSRSISTCSSCGKPPSCTSSASVRQRSTPLLASLAYDKVWLIETRNKHPADNYACFNVAFTCSASLNIYKRKTHPTSSPLATAGVGY